MTPPEDFGRGVADDAQTLALLHGRELDGAAIVALKTLDFPDNLALLPRRGADRKAWQLLHLALGSLPEPHGAAELDDLAADYAAIYLTGAIGAPPVESAWLDEDRLCFQGRMFELRKAYLKEGWANPTPRHRPDDHLALQLEFVAHLAAKASAIDDWRRLAAHLDEHLLAWLPAFRDRVISRSGSLFYAGLAAVTVAWCRRLRQCLNLFPADDEDAGDHQGGTE